MLKIEKAIQTIDEVICRHIDNSKGNERGIISQDILPHLRNFVEHIAMKIYSNGNDIEVDYKNIGNGIDFIKSKGNFRFLKKFHELLQITVSHYTLDEENSERLMLKYYEYLLRIKNYMKDNYHIELLKNINDFPLNTDSTLNEYYEKVTEKIEEVNDLEDDSLHKGRYYIQKIKPFFINNKVYYEVTFTPAIDNVSKFDRIIAFTKFDIMMNYSVKLTIRDENISINNQEMPIHIIEDWEVSIRPCELNNFSRLFDMPIKVYSNSSEYKMLMKYLTETGLNLLEILEQPRENYTRLINELYKGIDKPLFVYVLRECYLLLEKNSPGSNVVRYLLYKLNNKVIKNQCDRYGIREQLSCLRLKWGCIPFDQMPFCSSLINHNPKLMDLLHSINLKGREHEFLARFITSNTEKNGNLYTNYKELERFEDIDNFINKYNQNIYWKHSHRRLESSGKNIYIKGYEDDTISIIKRLEELSTKGIEGYRNSVDSWLNSTAYVIDCDEKKEVIKEIFEKSRVAMIYGAAGSGKSTLINHISNFFSDKEKLFLTNTNPAIDNLKRKVSSANSIFKTISKFLLKGNNEVEYDILIIDECSTVSNSDMRKIINKAKFKVLVLVGDVFQIESILFGNWFELAQYFESINKSSIHSLNATYRTDNKSLLKFWDQVRKIDDEILEVITKNNFSSNLDESVFIPSAEDEIILCLNYDGLYGINNINKFLQSNNSNKPIKWNMQTYKVGDPVLFNETDRFSPVIYNNLKGRIKGIKKHREEIEFDIEIEKSINALDIEDCDLEIIGTSDSGFTTIKFSVDKYRNTDEDDLSASSIIPFQVAYAVSIHKAQGLEYDSVKIIITNEIDEMVTHNIFYTAVTRAKEKLKLFWTPESEKKVLSQIEKKDNKKDAYLLKNKMKDQ